MYDGVVSYRLFVAEDRANASMLSVQPRCSSSERDEVVCVR